MILNQRKIGLFATFSRSDLLWKVEKKISMHVLKKKLNQGSRKISSTVRPPKIAAGIKRSRVYQDNVKAYPYYIA